MKKTLVLTLLSVIGLTSLKAQSIGTFSKIRDLSIGNDNSTTVTYSEKRDSMLIFIGTSNGPNGTITNHYGENDVFIHVVDTAGNFIYQKNIGGTKNDVLGEVLKDTTGNYHLLIRSNSQISGSKTVSQFPQSSYPNHKVVYELYHVILDSNFTTLNEYVYFPYFSNYTPPLLNSAEDPFYISDVTAVYNESTNTITLASSYVYDWSSSQNNYSGVVTNALDLNGNIINASGFTGPSWSYYCPNPTPYYRLDMKKLSTGEIVILTNIATNGGCSNYPNFVIVQENANIVTDRLIKAGNNTNLYGVEKLNNNNFLIIANSEAIVSNDRTIAPRIGSSTINNNDIWVFELDQTYSIVNEWAFGTNNGINASSSIETTKIGNNLIILTAAFGSGLDKTEPSTGGSDYWLLDIDLTTMNILKDKSFGGTADEKVTNMLITDNSLFMAGTSKSGVSLPNKSTPLISTATNGFDAWIIETQLCNVLPPLLVGSNYLNPSYFADKCNAESYNLSIVNPKSNYTYEWTNNNYNLIDTGVTFTKAHPTMPYSYTKTEDNYVRAVNTTNGCVSEYRLFQTRYAKYLPAPSLFNAPLPTVCKNDSVLLVADVNGMYNNHTFNWYQYNDSVPFAVANNTYSLPLYQDSTLIYLSTHDSTCATYIFSSCIKKKYCESQRLEIKAPTEVVPLPVTNTPQTMYCIDAIASFNTVPNSNIANYKWFNSIHYNDSIGVGNNFNYTVPDTDTIYVVGYNNNGCPSTDVPLFLKSNELYPSFTTTSTNIIEGSYLYFTNTTQSLHGVTSYQWQFSDGLINQDTNTYHYFYQSGMNDITLTASDSAGCTTSKLFANHINVNPCMCNRLQREGINIYPTVVDNQFTITKDNDKQYRILMYDLRGVEYLNTTIKDYTNLIQNLNLNKGMYIIKIIGENGFVETEKIIKM